jgi:hypothetical protein
MPFEQAALHPPDRVDRRWFVLLAAAFVMTRLVGVFTFAPHNDEAIYAVEAQEVAAGWAENKYMTLDGRHPGDYRQPLLSWLTALTVGLTPDPLVGVRLTTLAVASVGFVCLLLLVRRLGGPWAALWTGWVYVFSAYYSYFDAVALNEPLLYGLGGAYLWCLYGAVAGRCLLMAPAALLLTGMLLTKDSARLWVAVSAAVPFLAATSRYGTPLLPARRTILDLAKVAGVAGAGFALHAAVIPSRFDALKSESVQVRHYLMNATELAGWPVDLWEKNVSFLVTNVLAADLGYLGLLASAVTIAAGVVRSFARGDRPGRWLILILLGMFVAATAPIALIAKVNFVRYYGSGLSLLYAATAVAADRLVRSGSAGRRWDRVVVLAIVCLGIMRLSDTYLPALDWGQSDLAVCETPVGWASGLGLRDAVETLRGLEPGVLLVDPQWGHPGSYIFLRRNANPQLDLDELVPSNVNACTELLARGQLPGDRLYMVLDSCRQEYPVLWKWLSAHPGILAERTVIRRKYRDQETNDYSIVIIALYRTNHLPNPKLVPFP